jgi:hypothetical protein
MAAMRIAPLFLPVLFFLSCLKGICFSLRHSIPAWYQSVLNGHDFSRTYPGSPHFPVLWEQRLDVMKELADYLARYNK